MISTFAQANERQRTIRGCALPRTNDGSGCLEVNRVVGESAVTKLCATAPLRLLAPRSRGPSVWAYTATFGGGMVAGDQTRVDVHVGPQARCLLTTQASSKVYRNPDRRPCRHFVHAKVATDAVLVFAPDPVQCFANAFYEQRQEFHLESGAGLVLLDWLCSGRAARGERWAFAHYSSRNEILLHDVSGPLLLDSLHLDPEDGPLASPSRMGRFDCVAMLAIVGEPFRDAAESVLVAVSRWPVDRRAALLCSASPLRLGTVLRVAGPNVEAVAHTLRPHLNFLCDWLGDDPWAGKW